MDVTAPVTQTVMFICVGQGYGLVYVSWFSSGRSSPRSSRDKSIFTTIVTSDNITSILTIPDIINNDEGRYRCRYNNSGGETDSVRSRLIVAGKYECYYFNLYVVYFVYHLVPPPEIKSHPMNTRVNNGSNVTFNCVSFSYAPVNFTWLKNGVMLLDGDVNIVINVDNDEDNNTYTTTLIILDVQLSDNGVYVCSVTNKEDSTLSDLANLSVIGKVIVIKLLIVIGFKKLIYVEDAY